jgi:predicted ABC-type ATPase
VASADRPCVVVLGGPNGAGKTTLSKHILRDVLDIQDFVNADQIALGLSAFAPERASIAAGRIMLRQLRDLAERRRNFAFETTLASRSFAPWIHKLMHGGGFSFHLEFLWLPGDEFAVQRVAQRVRKGGHDVPAYVVRRRYRVCMGNFIRLYRPLATTWHCYDTSSLVPRLLAKGGEQQADEIFDSTCWTAIKEVRRGAPESA